MASGRIQQKTPLPAIPQFLGRLPSNISDIVDVFTGRYQATHVPSRYRCITTVLQVTIWKRYRHINFKKTVVLDITQSQFSSNHSSSHVTDCSLCPVSNSELILKLQVRISCQTLGKVGSKEF
jgi:hypothetical protein